MYQTKMFGVALVAVLFSRLAFSLWQEQQDAKTGKGEKVLGFGGPLPSQKPLLLCAMHYVVGVIIVWPFVPIFVASFRIFINVHSDHDLSDLSDKVFTSIAKFYVLAESQKSPYFVIIMVVLFYPVVPALLNLMLRFVTNEFVRYTVVQCAPNGQMRTEMRLECDVSRKNLLRKIKLLFYSNEAENGSDSTGGSYCEPVLVGDGEICVGKIKYNEKCELGTGSWGTSVFKGCFGNRKAAVKRISAHRFTLADREVKRLCESDAHENVIRYYGTEQDRQFRYIAIELCAGTLEDYVKYGLLRDKISPLEIMYQATKGTEHIHGLGIVHRDIKPQNILLSLPDNLRCVRAKISDFGLSKKLNNGKESFSQNSGETGTYGWIAPEMKRGQRVTMSVDIFSLGCVFYYVLSNGFHPFGEKEVCQINILSGDFDLDKLRPDNNRDILAQEVIKDMLQSDGSKRPSARAIANHPLFWSNDRKLAFVLVVSERVEKSTPMEEPLRSVEKNARLVVREDWSRHLDDKVTANLRNFRDYQGYSVSHLLRAIRNKKSHYLELPLEVQRALGTIPHEFMKNWIRQFPFLISHTYHAMAAISSEHSFREYYDEAVGPHGGYKFTKPAYFLCDDNDNDKLIRYYKGQQEKKKNSGNNSTRRRR